MSIKATPARRERQSPDYKSLPRAARLRVRHVCELTGLSVASVWRLSSDKNSRFPKPRKDGHITSWSYGETLDYLEARA